MLSDLAIVLFAFSTLITARETIPFPFGAVEPTEGGGTNVHTGVGVGDAGIGSDLTFGSPGNPGIGGSSGVYGGGKQYGLGSNIGWGNGLNWGSGIVAGKAEDQSNNYRNGKNLRKEQKFAAGTGGQLSLANSNNAGVSGSSGVNIGDTSYGTGSSLGWGQNQGLNWQSGVQAGKNSPGGRGKPNGSRQEKQNSRQGQKFAAGTGGQLSPANPSNAGVSGSSGVNIGDSSYGTGSSLGWGQNQGLNWQSGVQAGRQLPEGRPKPNGNRQNKPNSRQGQKFTAGTGGQLSLENPSNAGISGSSGVNIGDSSYGTGSSFGWGQNQDLSWQSGVQAGRQLPETRSNLLR